MSIYTIIKNGDLEKLKKKIEEGVDLNERTKVGHCYSPLELSIIYDAWECFSEIMDKGVDINIISTTTYWKDSDFSYQDGCAFGYAMDRAARKGDTRYFDILYAREDLEPINGLIGTIMVSATTLNAGFISPIRNPKNCAGL